MAEHLLPLLTRGFRVFHDVPAKGANSAKMSQDEADRKAGEYLREHGWPGSLRNTENITRFIAVEARSYVLSVAGLMRRSDVPSSTLQAERILAESPDMAANGGSCLAAPDGSWIIEPVTGREVLLTAMIDQRRVREERQNFDPAGHYSRPDVTQLTVNRNRQGTLRIVE